MILILGGAASGRHAYAVSLGIADEDCAEVTAEDAAAFGEELSLPGGHPALSPTVARLSLFRAVIATERGMGIIPLDATERTVREANGRLNCALAAAARCVVFMAAGIPRVIKGDILAALSARPRAVLCFRHGATEANLARRYAGSGTDLPLSPEGRVQAAQAREALVSFAAALPAALRDEVLRPAQIYVSPMRRARETARILYPEAQTALVVVDDFREMHFGAFEDKSAAELSSGQEDAYRAFVDSVTRDGMKSDVRCPPDAVGRGESVARFAARTEAALRGVTENARSRVIVIVAHGGTQMVLGDAYGGGAAYYQWQTPCAGFRFFTMR